MPENKTVPDTFAVTQFEIERNKIRCGKIVSLNKRELT